MGKTARSFRFCLALWVMMTCGMAKADDAVTVASLKKFFTNIAAYNEHYTQEKVYLHLDNNGYFPGEKIWFKAYVFKASTLLPTTLSKVLYVELVMPDGQVVERQTLPIINGRTYGDISLENIFITGYYEVRAYTRAMLNWDASYVYSRVVPIYDVPKDTTQFSTLSFRKSTEDRKLIRLDGRPKPAPLFPMESKSKKVELGFYPQGGNIVKGLESKVAYRLTNKEGQSLQQSIAIYKADGTQIATSQPLHEGMGSFMLPTDWDGGYAEVDGEKFNLPEAQPRGCELSARETSEGLTWTVSSTADMARQLVGLSVTCRGQACHFDTVRLAGNAKAQQFSIPRQWLKDGIHQVTLFTPEGQVLAERMVWIAPHKKPLIFEVKQNAKVFQPFSPIVLDFSLQDAEGQPLQGEFSLSVQDVAGMVAPDVVNLQTDMLLTSDLKGYIHQPEYYFEKNDDSHAEALDLLLLVQGWRRYEWKEMAGVEAKEIAYPAEEQLMLDGKIVKSPKDDTPITNMNVNLVMMSDTRLREVSTKTADDGTFAIGFGKGFYDNRLGFISVTNDKDKTQSCAVKLSRNFHPSAQAYEPMALTSLERKDLRQTLTAEQPHTFQWVDTIPKVHHLGEAKVTEKKHYTSQYGTRYTYLGGEKAGRQIATVYYNLEDEMQRLMDDGQYEPLLWDWLKKQNPYFDYDLIERGKSYASNAELDGRVGKGVRGRDVTSKAAQEWFRQTWGNGEKEEEEKKTIDPSKGVPSKDIDEYNERAEMEASFALTYKLRPVTVMLDNKYPVKHDLNILGSDVRSLYIVEDNTILGSILPDSIFMDTRQPVVFLLYSNLDIPLLNKYKKGTRTTILHGYSRPTEFFSPDYRKADAPTPTDVRRTLYWAPDMVTDSDGHANVIFYSNSRPQSQIHVNAQGIAVNGQMFGSE
ncbi:MAG: hypothetical protein IJ244_04665 [Bacteroidaceae bacterium]|nr:hypothetical protein [Bacteroidaceae bacterium]